jgi:antitoxin HigA-1
MLNSFRSEAARRDGVPPVEGCVAALQAVAACYRWQRPRGSHHHSVRLVGSGRNRHAPVVLRLIAQPSPLRAAGAISVMPRLPTRITPYRLAKEIGVSQRRVGEILAGQRWITADTGLRLSRALGLSDMFWINLQARYDADLVRIEKSKELAHIHPLTACG